MTPRTVLAVHRHATRLGGRALIDGDCVVVTHPVWGTVAEVYRDAADNRWVNARLLGLVFSGLTRRGVRTAGTLRELRAVGVRAYPTPAAALADCVSDGDS